MVSNLYTAKEFFKKQTAGKVATGLPMNKKLKLDSKGYYLNKYTTKGQLYRQDVKDTDQIYARNEGVTMYSKERDRNRTDVRHKKEGVKKHKKTAFATDRKAVTSNRIYKI